MAYDQERPEKAVAAVSANANQPARPRGYRKTKADYDIERSDADAVRSRVLATFRPHYEALFRGKSVDDWNLRTAGENAIIESMYWM